MEGYLQGSKQKVVWCEAIGQASDQLQTLDAYVKLAKTWKLRAGLPIPSLGSSGNDFHIFYPSTSGWFREHIGHYCWKERERSSYITRTRLAEDVWFLDRDLFSDFDEPGSGRRINLDRWKSMIKARPSSAFHSTFSGRRSRCCTPKARISLFERSISCQDPPFCGDLPCSRQPNP